MRHCSHSTWRVFIFIDSFFSLVTLATQCNSSGCNMVIEVRVHLKFESILEN